ncbi:helix-turn-helix transcriptional regulator [Neisseria shayeganii]|uniref:AlpA family phage regulatory protein n=1 Tax=Neisseria shayeganii TaxID=607712 RepID=A0A7D7S8Z2_9NEIS|nr:hypothetical protein [Neisseria shayeganii]QMT41151.1 hypothetical protein H3L94_03715 [Neisseria shayeganii]
MTFDFASNDVLLGIDDICQKLSISRSTFERLRRNKQSSANSNLRSDEFAGLSTFPEPTILLGRSPRWSATVLNEWLRKNSRKSSYLENMP